MPTKTVSRVVGFATCVVALLVAVALRDGAGAAREPAEPPAVARPPARTWGQFAVDPYLQFVTQTSAVIMAETAKPMACTVSYGTALPFAQTAATAQPGTMHEVPLTGLLPNTKYFYQVACQVADEPVVGKVLTFLTACDASQAYSFTVIGDTQKNPTVTGKLAKLMWERRPNFVLHLGDVVDNGPDRKEWTDELFKPCRELFGRVPVYPCLGNHEKNHAHYYQYFSLPAPENYYSFRHGNAEFFSLDSNKPIAPGGVQYEWLEKGLKASTAKWKFCYHHHPCYTSDDNDYGDTWKGASKLGEARVQALIPLYEKYNVDFALNGHIHTYERTWPLRAGKVRPADGVVYLTSGGGGGALEDVAPTPAFFKNQGRADYHFCYFTVFDGQLACKVFDHEGRLFDSFEVKKP